VKRSEWERAEPLELAGIAFACSAAFWAVSFWLLEWLPVSWRLFAGLTLAGSFFVLALVRRSSISFSWSVWRRSPAMALSQAGLLTVLLLLRLIFAAT
jgi:hypothetical protein